MPSNSGWLARGGKIASSPGSGQAPGSARQNPTGHPYPSRLRAVFGIIFFLALPLSAAPPAKHLSVYSNVANYSLPIVQRQGRDYIGLLELLEPLGTVNAKSEGSRWRLHYNNVLGEFTVDRNRARIQGRDVDLYA